MIIMIMQRYITDVDLGPIDASLLQAGSVWVLL